MAVDVVDVVMNVRARNLARRSAPTQPKLGKGASVMSVKKP